MPVRATANIRHGLSADAARFACLGVSSHADVIGWQEIETSANRAGVRSLKGWSHHMPEGGAGAVPISWRTEAFDLLDSGAAQIGEAVAEGGFRSPARFLTWVVLRDKAGAVTCHLNTHLIQQAFSSHPEHRDEWNRQAERLAFYTDRLATAWGAVVGSGDVNRSKWTPPGTVGHWATKPTIGNVYYDVLWTSGGVTMSRPGRVATPSDHAALVAPYETEAPVAISQNGYPANRRDATKVWRIPGTRREVRLHAGDAGFLLVDFAAWFHAHIEAIGGGQLDDWGYAERPIRGSTTTLSNHASGTAIDLNATRHPLGKRGTFTPEQAAAIRLKLREYDGCIRWGGDYANRADEMHFEINKPPAAVTTVAFRLRDKDWFDMATKEDLKDAIREVLAEETNPAPSSDAGLAGRRISLTQMLTRIHQIVAADRSEAHASKD